MNNDETLVGETCSIDDGHKEKGSDGAIVTREVDSQSVKRVRRATRTPRWLQDFVAYTAAVVETHDASSHGNEVVVMSKPNVLNETDLR